MGNVHMEASQINYRGGETKMSVEEALKNTSGEAAAIAQLQEDVSDLQDVTEDLGDAVKLNTQDLTTRSRTKNILPITVSGVKAANISGTWVGNSYTMSGVTFTLGTDTSGNITSVTATGTATDDAILYTGECAISAPVIASGSPADGSDESYYEVFLVGSWDPTNREYGTGKEFETGTIQNAAMVVSSGYEIPEGGIVFHPMIRLASATYIDYEPYIPSMNGRVSALENAEPTTWNYSTSEVNTGQKWIDGNDIYVKSFEFTSFTAGSNNFGAVASDASEIVKFDGVFIKTVSNVSYNLPLSRYDNASNYNQLYISDNIIFTIADADFATSTYKLRLNVYYTKTTV